MLDGRRLVTIPPSAIAYRLKPVVAVRREERFDTALAVRLEQGTGVVRNVSANGIYFVTGVALQEGAPVKFTLEFEDFPGGPVAVNCSGRIVRMEAEGTQKGVAASIDCFKFFRLPVKP